MLLYSIDGVEMTRVPHNDQFDEWQSRLSSQEIEAIHNEFDHMLDRKLSSGQEILTSSWIPKELCHDDGHEWFGTPFQVIWEKACRQNWEHTGWCFGLFLWDHMMKRGEDWCFYKSGGDDDIRGTTYFRRR
jgi:hypothetical protein